MRRSLPPRAPAITRALAKIEKPDGEDGCWLWTGHIANATRAPTIALEPGMPIDARKLIWEHTNGLLPEGLHLARCEESTRCVNPNHNDPATRSEINRRWWARKKRREAA